VPDRVRVKICGLTRREDVEMAVELGADYVGVVLTAGFARSVDRDLAPGLVRDLVRDLPATPVAVLVDEDLEAAASLAETLGAGVVQLHGEEPPEVAEALRALGPWEVWKAVRVRTPSDVTDALDRYGSVVDGILVEGWKEGVVGGGGAQADFAVLEEIRGAVSDDLTLVLAGGLTPANVAEGRDSLPPTEFCADGRPHGPVWSFWRTLRSGDAHPGAGRAGGGLRRGGAGPRVPHGTR